MVKKVRRKWKMCGEMDSSVCFWVCRDFLHEKENLWHNIQVKLDVLRVICIIFAR